MVTAPNFYNLGDQAIYSAGDFFIPQERFRAAPYNVNTPTAPDDPAAAGLPAIYQAGGGDGFNPYNTNMSNIRQDYNPFPSRQAGEIYSKTFNPQSTFDPNLLRAQNTANLIRNYESGTGPGVMRLGKTVFDVKDYSPDQRAFLKESADDFIDDARMQYATEGQFVDPYDPNYSSMTEAQKFMDNYPEYYGVPSGVPETGVKGFLDKAINFIPGIGTIKRGAEFLKGMMPINERAIMENEARGAGIFTDDIGRIVTDDYNTAGGIMAGYNLNQIDASTFDKRRATIEKTIADKKAKGLDTSVLENRLDLLDEAEENILGARKRTQQIYKMRADKRAADKARKEAEKAAAAAATARQAAFDQARSDRDRAVSSGLDAAIREGRDTSGFDRPSSGAYAEGAGMGVGGGYGSDFGFLKDGGRVQYMDGGLADLVDIYD